MSRNSVAALRVQELAKSRRPFLARGSKLVRCPACLLAQIYCVCAERPEPQGKSAFLMLMYHGEVFKPSNTGRLIADVIADNHAHQWDRTIHDPELLALLADERYAPIVVFPHQYAAPEQCIHSPQELDSVKAGKTPLFIMLDGTWREAKKMFKSPYLANLPVLGIQPEAESAYKLREAVHLHQLCTVEVAVEVLKLADDGDAANALAAYFAHFRDQYLRAKPPSHGQERSMSTLFGEGTDGEVG